MKKSPEESKGCFLAVSFAFCGLMAIIAFGFYFFRWFDSPLVEEHFESGDPGWLVIGDAQGDSNKPTYESTGGNPGCFMSALDSAVDGLWYWSAPVSFLDQLSAKWESDGSPRARLQFDLKQSELSNPLEGKDIVLSGNHLEIYFKDIDPPGIEWTSYSIPLTPSAGWLNTATDEPVSNEEMNEVLSHLDILWIRGEFQTEENTGSIDNIVVR
tara:strand:+ start:2153 stop:2791 length:639 start_codon:yes stop_codon:yes gene_type:complete